MESLVHAMLSNALVAAVLALAIAVLGRAWHRPAVIHGFCLVVMIKLVTPPLVPVSLPTSASLMSSLPAATVIRANLPEPPGAGAAAVPDLGASDTELQAPELGPADAPGMPEARDPLIEIGESRSRQAPDANDWLGTALALLEDWKWEQIVLAAVLSGALLWWGVAAVRVVRFERVLRDVRPVDRQWQVQTDELARRLGVRVIPTVCLVPGRVPPLLWAFGRRPRLLVPSQLWSTMSQDERTSLLVHELAHLKRRDHWVRWLELLVAGLYWWHPAVWWVRRRLREAEEQCCDAWVLWAMPQGAKTYAAALLAALEFVSGGRPAPATASAIGGHGPISCLKRRMRMIMRANTPKGLSWAGRLAVLGTAALLLPLAPSWAQKPSPEAPTAQVVPFTDFNTARPDLGLARAPGRPEAERIPALVPTGRAGEQQANEKLDARVNEELSKDPEVARLTKEIKGLEAELAHIKRVVSSANDPARVVVERKVKKLNEDYVRLLNEKYPVLLARLRQDDDDDDDAKDEKSREAAERFEKHVRDLIGKLVDEIGPVADEVRKAVERSVDEIRKSLDKEDLSTDDLRRALERGHDEMRRSFESGGSIDKEAREAWERARNELGEAWDRVREDLREVVRDEREGVRERRRELLDRARVARERARAEAQAERERLRARSGAETGRDDLESARREVQELRQQLERATRRLDELQRRQMESQRSRRLVPNAETAPAPRSPGAPAAPETPARPAQPGMRRLRPNVAPGGPGLRRFAPGPENDRRLRELEDKMDRLLKELEGLKGEKKNEPEKTSARLTLPGHFDRLLGGLY
jgi:beta-lactamase regulating signal transducer with metallopeptidase domain